MINVSYWAESISPETRGTDCSKNNPCLWEPYCVLLLLSVRRFCEVIDMMWGRCTTLRPEWLIISQQNVYKIAIPLANYPICLVQSWNATSLQDGKYLSGHTFLAILGERDQCTFRFHCRSTNLSFALPTVCLRWHASQSRCHREGFQMFWLTGPAQQFATA